MIQVMSERLLVEREVAERLGMAVQTVRGWRVRGCGPVYVKLGRSVRYRESDVEAFVRAGRVERGEP